MWVQDVDQRMLSTYPLHRINHPQTTAIRKDVWALFGVLHTIAPRRPKRSATGPANRTAMHVPVANTIKAHERGHSMQQYLLCTERQSDGAVTGARGVCIPLQKSDRLWSLHLHHYPGLVSQNSSGIAYKRASRSMGCAVHKRRTPSY